MIVDIRTHYPIQLDKLKSGQALGLGEDIIWKYMYIKREIILVAPSQSN